MSRNWDWPKYEEEKKIPFQAINEGVMQSYDGRLNIGNESAMQMQLYESDTIVLPLCLHAKRWGLGKNGKATTEWGPSPSSRVLLLPDSRMQFWLSCPASLHHIFYVFLFYIYIKISLVSIFVPTLA
ncbi:hypothetical protein ES332_D08G079200v1 [Gossypium tomentosum]|uniref:Uncharacterized protein n=1 Tax=Gossypium tomentosum TaxID=34277 RepID=A0A5D2JRX8_GOSTO|nr:hypothetical protein ES332_D08G079200v1 [Gossypium tomentosum]